MVCLVIIQSLGLAFSIYDLFYLNRIISEAPVTESAHTFYLQKNQIQYWVSTFAYLGYVLLFLTWLYRTYRNVYMKEPGQAPYKPALVAFSLVIPIFNLYGPYQIMKFIWWGNSSSIEQLERGYKTIKTWWFLSLLTALFSRLMVYRFSGAQYAEELRTATYYSLVLFALWIHVLLRSIRLVNSIDRLEREA